MTKLWRYVEPAEDGITPVYTTLTEQEIVERYWDYMYERVLASKGKEAADSMTESDCIWSFICVHWAWLVTEEKI